jgi:hypothetical protein
MSEADFYVKAEFSAYSIKNNGFKNDKDFIEKMNKVLRRCKALHEHWQDIRGMDVPEETMRNNVRDYDPDIYDRLKLDEFKPEWGKQNMYTGLIPHWDIELTEFDFDPAGESDHALLMFSGELWSSANLDPFMKLLKSFGALRAGWINGNDVSPHDSIEMS